MRDVGSNLTPDASHSLARRVWRVNWLVALLTTAIAMIGAITLYSVAGGSSSPWAERHLLRFFLCLALMLAIALSPQRLWLSAAYPFYILTLVLLAFVPVFGVHAMGARRWLGVGGLVIQPAEIMKVALILALARYYQWLPHERRSSPLAVAFALLAIAAPSALTLQQPDLGTAVLFAACGLAVMTLAGVNLLYFAAGAGGAIATAPLLWSSLHDYQRRRLEVFLDPDKDPLGAGYHVTQSKIALGSGGLEGKGFMAGTQSQLDFLPEKHTDFIFTMIAEEWGFAGAMLLLALYAALIATVMLMSLRARSPFARLVIAGTAVVLSTYAVINVGMVTGLVPVVGVPLPLVSYGGSSMLSVMASLGLAMSCYVHRDERIHRKDLGPFV